MPEASLLTEETRAHIGRTSEPVTARITRRMAQRAMDLYLGHHDRPLVEGQPVPGVVLVALQAEGYVLETPDLMPNSVLISNEMQFERQLLLGEELIIQSRVADISERFGGRFGYSLYLRTEVDFTDAAGALAARTVQTLMYYDAANARDGGDEQ
jgi:hydroxyacyl-ACP dehydratase HTD2-like protein with hotdog domain